MSLTDKIKNLVKVIPVTDPDTPVDLIAVVPNWVAADKGRVVYSKHRGYAIEIAEGAWLKPFECNEQDGAMSDLIEALLYSAEEDEEKAISLCQSKKWWNWNLEPHEIELSDDRPCTCGSSLPWWSCSEASPYCG